MFSIRPVASIVIVIASVVVAPASQATARETHRAPGSGIAALKCSPSKGKKVTWHGGNVWSYDFVKIVYWGSWWRHHGQAPKTELKKLYSGLGSSRWARTLTQYCYRGFPPAWPVTSLLVPNGVVTDSRNPPPAPTEKQLGDEALWALAHTGRGSGAPRNGNPRPIVVIVTPPASTPAFYKTHPRACGHHSWIKISQFPQPQGLPWIDIPYGQIKRDACGWKLQQGTPATLSVVAGHEWAEAVTDPFVGGHGFLGTAWATAGRPGSEIGDLCARFLRQSSFVLQLKTGRFVMQKLWSNRVGKTGSCITQS